MYREPQRRAGIEISRVGEVLVTLTPGSPGRRASGYRVSAGLVLTAAHALRQASKVRIRFDAAQPGEWVAPVTHIVEFPEIDIAVLSIDPHDHNQVEPVRFGRIAERDAVIECSMVGFPRFKIKRGPSQPLDGGPFLYRDSCHAMGTVAVYSNRKQGTLEVSVLAPERDPDPNVSPWEGMSGAAVFAAGRIVGVITEHNRAEGLGKLTASRVDRWYDKLTPKRLDQLREMLKIPEERNQLGDVVPPRAGEIVEARYLAQARDNAPAQLLGRDDELAELAAFCAGTENYQWWQGPPGAGKTALAAWFVLHPPAGVRVVSFFVTRRLPGQADSSAFTAALIEQLAAAADEAIAEPASRAGRDHERRRLLDRAAARMRECGMRLLLVIDGLDEGK